MPHCLIEYSENVGEAGNLPGLVGKIAAKYRDSNGVFPVVGIRVRAVAVRDYVVADGKPDNAFVHATCVVAPGRPGEFLQSFFGALFEIMKEHLAPAAAGRFLGLSLDIVEAGAGRSFKHNFGLAT